MLRVNFVFMGSDVPETLLHGKCTYTAGHTYDRPMAGKTDLA
jgi:hypothetical protein